MSDKARCKYSVDELKRQAREYGVVDTIIRIEPSAIGDPVVKKIWENVHSGLDRLEELLGE